MAYQDLVDAIYRSKRRQEAYGQNIKNLPNQREQEIAKRKKEIEEKYRKLMQEEIDLMIEGIDEKYNYRTQFSNADIYTEMGIRKKLEFIQLSLKINDVPEYTRKLIKELERKTGKDWVELHLTLKNTEKHPGIRKIRNGKIHGGLYEINCLVSYRDMDEVIDALIDTYKASDIGMVVNGISDDVAKLTRQYNRLSDECKIYVVSTKNIHSYDAESETFRNIKEDQYFKHVYPSKGKEVTVTSLNKLKYRTCLDDTSIHSMGATMSKIVGDFKNKLLDERYNQLLAEDKQFVSDVIEIQNNEVLDPTK